MKNPVLLHIAVYIFIIFTICGQAYATDAPKLETTVVTLQNRLPQDILPGITPFLDKGGQIKTFENQLIIQSSASNIATLKSIIAQLDVAVKKLMITVSNGHDKPSEMMSISPNGDVTFGQEPDGPHNLTISTSRETDRQVDTIRVDNGQVAFINSGVTIPLITDQFAADDHYQRNGQLNATSIGAAQESNLVGVNSASDIARAAGQSIDYQNVSNGFYVRPQLIGKEVKLDLLTKNDQPSDNYNNNPAMNPAYTTFKAATTVMVPVGKWTYFGGNQNQDDMNSGTTIRTGSRDDSKKSLWLRVDLIPDS
ncbi:MAG: hypothetical protein HYX61_13220 [Gammaproteobacteria bacterium]|nr:hypothetical protein [Gammaproteobacteria bacterium]